MINMREVELLFHQLSLQNEFMSADLKPSCFDWHNKRSINNRCFR